MKAISKKLSEIIPYDNNAKIHSESQINAVANSIKEFGVVQPIVVDEAGIIIIGHCRYEAAKKLGLKTFPVIVAKLSENQSKALRLIDNKTNESEWNSSLYEEIAKIKDDFVLEDLGFSLLDLIEMDSEYEPESLDFEDEEFFVENAESQLKSKQVTITYESEAEQEWLSAKTGQEKLKVVYRAAEIC